MLTGERAALGPLRREHLPSFAQWINDPEVRRGLAYRGLANEDAELKWYEEMTEAARAPRPTAAAFAVHTSAPMPSGWHSTGRSWRWDSLLMDATAAEDESSVLGRLRPEG